MACLKAIFSHIHFPNISSPPGTLTSQISQREALLRGAEKRPGTVSKVAQCQRKKPKQFWTL